jgi:DNA repair exonuclease SbcCD ATPase subunit
VAGIKRVADERWTSHREAHQALAASLAEYKEAANEWRATLNDIRTAGVTRAEYSAEHRAIEQKLEASVATLDGRIDAIERLVEQANSERLATRVLLGSIRNLVLLGFTILGGVLALLIYLRP